jgi:hypothetical protein
MKFMGITEYARYRGVSHAAVRKAINSGVVRLNSNKKIDVAEADRNWTIRGTTNKNVTAPEITEDDLKRLDEIEIDLDSSDDVFETAKSKAILDLYKAKLAKLKVEQAEGSLVPISDIETEFFNVARRTRDALLNVPNRIAAELASETDPLKVHNVLTKALTEALEELANNV